MKNPHTTLKGMIKAGHQIESPLLLMSKETAVEIFGYVVKEFEGIPIEIDNTLPKDNVYLKSRL
jgi:hypothetical protein